MSSKIKLDTKYGNVEFFAFEEGGEEAVIAINTNFHDKTPFLRIHSSCLFSESFHTTDCDCARQLDAALEHIATQGGLIIYLYQEGRGVGIVDKIKAIAIEQNEGLNTSDAFAKLGHGPDVRSYTLVIKILKILGIKEVILDTSNPNKVKALEDEGIVIADRLRLKIKTTEKIDQYVNSKIKVLGHHESN